MHFLIRLLINAAAIWVAVHTVPGLSYDGTRGTLYILDIPVGSLLIVALVFGVLNASVRPMLKLLTFPLLILTLGLFTFVINAFMLWLTGWISERLDLGFHVAGFRAAFLGGLVVSIVSLLLSFFVRSRRHSEMRTV